MLLLWKCFCSRIYEDKPWLTPCPAAAAAADDSGSMAFEENGERIDDLKLIGSKVSRWC
jgi:hypothetical protein